MRKIVSNFFISLDGVVHAPNEWHFPYFSDEMGEVVGAGMGTATAMLLGRRGYDEWAAFWPNQNADDPFAATLNGMQKFVLTHRPLDEPVWANSTAVTDDAADTIRALKEQGEGDIQMSGSAITVRCCSRRACSTSSTCSCTPSPSAGDSACSRTATPPSSNSRRPRRCRTASCTWSTGRPPD